MSKRFTDSDKFRDSWYRKLSPKMKCFWEYLLAECDVSGIIDLDLESASFHIGDNISEQDLFSLGERIIKLPDGKYFIPKFISFQQGKLNIQNSAHKPIIEKLKKYGLQEDLSLETFINTLLGCDGGRPEVNHPSKEGLPSISNSNSKSNNNINIYNNNINNINNKKSENFDFLENQSKQSEQSENSKKLKTELTVYENGLFDEFWNLYTPVKSSDGKMVGKGSKEDAKKRFLKILKGGESYANIIRGLQRYIKFCRENNQLTCGVGVFLNQKRWLDDYDCQTVDAEFSSGQRQKPTSVLETYAELINQCGN